MVQEEVTTYNILNKQNIKQFNETFQNASVPKQLTKLCRLLQPIMIQVLVQVTNGNDVDADLLTIGQKHYKCTNHVFMFYYIKTI